MVLAKSSQSHCSQSHDHTRQDAKVEAISANAPKLMALAPRISDCWSPEFQSDALVCSPDHGLRPDSNEPQLVTGALYAGEDLRTRRVNQDQERV